LPPPPVDQRTDEYGYDDGHRHNEVTVMQRQQCQCMSVVVQCHLSDDYSIRVHYLAIYALLNEHALIREEAVALYHACFEFQIK
jgi:hypothetical protein